MTLAAVIITEEDWRGKQDWEKYKRAAAARGEPLEWSDLATNRIPDDQNFTRAPVFSGLWAMKWDEKKMDWIPDSANGGDPLVMQISRSDGSSPTNVSAAWQRAQLGNLLGWQSYYRSAPTNLADEFPTAPQPHSPGADVLLALSKYDATIEQLRLASRRPFGQLAVSYDFYDVKMMSRLMTYLAEIKYCFQVVGLRTRAELSDGRMDRAFDDVKLSLRLNDLLRQEPLLIEHLVSVATMNITLQPVYEGLVRHQWSDVQLKNFENELAQKDFLADYEKAMRGERVYAIGSIENLRFNHQIVGSDGCQFTTSAFRLMPSAFFYQNELALARMDEQYWFPLIDLGHRIVSPAVCRQKVAEVQSEIRHFQPYKLLALTAVAGIGQVVVTKFAKAQSSTDLAQTACALERYRLARGNYPETLAVLAPQYIETLPHDIINGQPLHYRRTEGENFILYSVGWNEKDDGGQISLRKDGSLDGEKGDWVWNSAAK